MFIQLQLAAQSLRDVADEFQEEGNDIIKIAKKMSQQMSQMAEFSRGRGELRVPRNSSHYYNKPCCVLILQDRTEMINTAKAIAANGQIIVHFANVISDHCTDKRLALCEIILVSMIYVQVYVY